MAGPPEWRRRIARFSATAGFFTADRKARFIAPEPPALAEAVSDEFPLRLNTGRLRDQWHTMTRSGLSPTLGAHRPEPFIEVHPADAEAYGLRHDGFAKVSTAYGSCILKVVVSDAQRRGSVFAPIHWSDLNASSARIGDLVTPATDPFSGQPEFKATPTAIAPVDFAWRGFALSRRPLALPSGTWWARVAVPDASGCTFATNQDLMTWHDLAPRLFPDAVLTEYVDRRRGIYRVAAFIDERLDGALFAGPADAPPQWSDLARHGRQARHRVQRPGGLRLLRRRHRCDPRRADVAQGGKRRGDRPCAARRNEMRKLPA